MEEREETGEKSDLRDPEGPLRDRKGTAEGPLRDRDADLKSDFAACVRPVLCIRHAHVHVGGAA